MDDINNKLNERFFVSEIKTYKQWMSVKASINNNNIIRSIKDGDVLISIAALLTTKDHNGTWYQKFIFQGNTQVAVLSQVRPISTARLYTRIGRLSRGDLQKLKSSYMKLFQNKNMP